MDNELTDSHLPKLVSSALRANTTWLEDAEVRQPFLQPWPLQPQLTKVLVMPPGQAKRIPPEWWSQHRDTIHDLHYVQGLPLVKKGGGQSVQRILEEHHGFSATRNQLEAYVKKLQQPKRLKKEEWRAVHTKLLELPAGTEHRLRLSGHILTPDQIQRAKRYALRDFGSSHAAPSNGVVLPWPKALLLEVRDDNGGWKVYIGESTVSNTDASREARAVASSESEEPVIEVTRPANHPFPQYQSGPMSSSFHSADHEHLLVSFASPPPPTFSGNQQVHFSNNSLEHFGPNFPVADQSHAPTDLSLFGFNQSHLRLELAASELQIEPFDESYGPWVLLGSPLPQYTVPFTPYPQLQTALLAVPARGVDLGAREQALHTEAGEAPELTTNVLVPPSATTLAQGLLQDANEILLVRKSLGGGVHELPDVNDVVDRLLSLLPEHIQGEVVIVRDANVDARLCYALLYSTANGFAGLRDIPPGAILQMLRKYREVNSQIFRCLRDCHDSQARSLADDLFRAAVEACDEDALIQVLQATRGSPNTVDPNEIACRLGKQGRLYTPIELAATFRHLGIVNILIAANSDVNKTYHPTHNGDRGALECAIRTSGQHGPVDLRLVRTILDCGSEVRVQCIVALVRRGQHDLVHELILRLPPSSHSQAFARGFLPDVVEYLGNDLASYIIRQLYASCQSTKCLQCFANHAEIMERILVRAAMRANSELVEFLLHHIAPTYSGLAGAIRSGSRHLIDLFLVCANVQRPSRCILDCHTMRTVGLKFDWNHPTTPLAEAIRKEDMSLVSELEKLGVLKHIDCAQHFEAAIFAAAETGNIQYLEKLFKIATGRGGKDLTRSLNVAIITGHTEVALFLLRKEADVNKRVGDSTWDTSLIHALTCRNRAVVDAILEADVFVNDHWVRRSGPAGQAMEAAASWGDLSVIHDLILMGFPIDVRGTSNASITALVTGVRTKNVDMVRLLLENGASPNARGEDVYDEKSGDSPLAVAITSGNEEIIQTLLDAGADPAEEAAFLAGLKHHQKSFDLLLQIFSLRHPNGKPHFGGTVLVEALKRGDETLLDTLLSAKFDVNSPAEYYEDQRLTVFGFAIIHWKRFNPNIVKLLIDRGDPESVVSIHNPREFSPEQDYKNATALLAAVTTRSEHIVNFLLDKGADINRPARRGLKRTPLQRACEIGSFKIVKLLVARGADVHQGPADRGGATALQLAAVSGSIKIAEFLLSYGASVHAEPSDIRGYTALEGAAENGRMQMMKCLWDAVSGTFKPEEVLSAKSRALQKGHRGCAEYIDVLIESTAFEGSGVMAHP